MARTIYDKVQANASGIMSRLKNPTQIAYQTKTRTPDGQGGFTTSWATTGTINAAIVPKSGNQRLAADRLESVTTISFYVLYADGSSITTANRILFDGRTFNINAVINHGEANAWLRLDCQEGVAT